MSNSNLVNVTIKSPNCNCPRNNTIQKITIHHMAGILSAQRCGELFARPERQGSSNYGIDSDGTVGLYVDECNRAWTSSSPSNDHQAVTIEVSNDEYGGQWHISDKAFHTLIDLCVDICQRNHIPELTWTGDASGSLTCHYFFANTNCPGDYLKSKMPEIASIVNAKLHGTYDDSKDYTKNDIYSTTSTTKNQHGFQYQVYTNHTWLPNVWNTQDYAGLPNSPIECVYVSSSEEHVYCQVHTLGGTWLPYVCDREDYAGIYGQMIDGIRIKTDRNDKDVLYRVSCCGEDYLSWVREDTDYAGIYGKPIDRLQIKYADHEKLPNDSIEKPQQSCTKPESNTITDSLNITYKVFANKWLPEVCGFNTEDENNGYAGIKNVPITAVMIADDIHVKVHLKNEHRWLPDVTGYDENDSNNGYAGIIGKEIDAIQIWSDNRDILYQVSTIEHGWYDKVSGNNHNDNDKEQGFAGFFGETIDRIICHYL